MAETILSKEQLDALRKLSSSPQEAFTSSAEHQDQLDDPNELTGNPSDADLETNEAESLDAFASKPSAADPETSRIDPPNGGNFALGKSALSSPDRLSGANNDSVDNFQLSSQPSPDPSIEKERAPRAKKVAPRSNRLSLPGYTSDSVDDQEDRLDIMPEVRVLTTVMMARDNSLPPLAIGLFGDWGSGKSFFMRKMRMVAKELAESAKNSQNPTYCASVVQIDFNAWHYIETNLWASLVATILEQLSVFVSPKMSPAEQRASMLEKLDSAKSAKAYAEQKLALEKIKLEEEEENLKSLTKNRIAEQQSLNQLSKRAFIDAINKDKAAKASLDNALKQLGISSLLSDATDLKQTLSEINRSGHRLSNILNTLGQQSPWQRYGTLILLLIMPLLIHWAATHIFALDGTTGDISTALTNIGGLIGLVSYRIKSAIGTIDASLKMAEEAIHTIEGNIHESEARLSINEKESKQKIAAIIIDEKLARDKVNSASQRIQEIEKNIQNFDECHSLAGFLTSRLQSRDYDQHLGLISTVRRDLESLSNHLQKETENPVERVILYVDDLDRCPADKVVDVLQAVHLLLAFPLFVVVVGVDSRWLLRSLQIHYAELSTEGNNPARGAARPQQFLEKIFQIPYSLRPMETDGLRRMMGQLNASTSQGKRANTEGSITAATGSTQISPKLLIIQSWEFDFTTQLGSLIKSPRSAKRLENIYRILKAAIPSSELDEFEGSINKPGTFQLPLLLLAMLIYDAGTTLAWFKEISNKDNQPDTISGIFRQSSGMSTITSASINLERIELFKRISKILFFPDFPQNVKLLHHWIPSVSRFTFSFPEA